MQRGSIKEFHKDEWHTAISGFKRAPLHYKSPAFCTYACPKSACNGWDNAVFSPEPSWVFCMFYGKNNEQTKNKDYFIDKNKANPSKDVLLTLGVSPISNIFYDSEKWFVLDKNQPILGMKTKFTGWALDSKDETLTALLYHFYLFLTSVSLLKNEEHWVWSS